MKTHLTLCFVLMLGSAGVFADDNTPTPKSFPGNLLADFTVVPQAPPNEGLLFVDHETASADGGRTWSEPRTVEFAKAVRNPQLIEMGGTYFMHGRARGGHFVIYRSPDGLRWDEGLILREAEAGAGAYSNSLVVGSQVPYETHQHYRQHV